MTTPRASSSNKKRFFSWKRRKLLCFVGVPLRCNFPGCERSCFCWESLRLFISVGDAMNDSDPDEPQKDQDEDIKIATISLCGASPAKSPLMDRNNLEDTSPLRSPIGAEPMDTTQVASVSRRLPAIGCSNSMPCSPTRHESDHSDSATQAPAHINPTGTVSSRFPFNNIRETVDWIIGLVPYL